MRQNFLQKHCSNELLLAYLDGEVSLRAERSLREHLRCCWRCRADLHELEQQADEVARLLTDQSGFPDPAHIADMKAEFLRWKREFEHNHALTPKFSLLDASSDRAVRASALAVVCLVALGLAVSPFREAPPNASELLAASKQSELRFHQNSLPIVQSLRIEAIEIETQTKRSLGRLEIWSDRENNRFTSQWTDPQGKLRHAVWRTDEGQRHVFPSKDEPAVIPVTEPKVESGPVEFSHFGSNFLGIQAGFLTWLQQRPWNPVSLTHGLAVLLEREGSVAKVEQLTTARGSPVFRLTVWCREEDGLAIVVLEVDARTFEPQLRSIRYGSGRRVFEVLLTVERAETVPGHRITDAIFQPVLAVNASGSRVSRKPIRTSLAPDKKLVSPTATELDLVEIQALYTLHRSEACLGEPIRVKREADAVIVRGMVDAPDRGRKDDLTTALAKLDHVRIEIRTVEEIMDALTPRGTKAPNIQTEELGTTQFSEYLSSLIQTRVERHLRKELGNTADPDKLRQRISMLSNNAVKLSDSALDQVWALRRLTERYGTPVRHGVSPEADRMLGDMVRDHIDTLQNLTVALRRTLDPVLGQIDTQLHHRQLTLDQPLKQQQGSRDSRQPPENRESSLTTVFREVERVHSLVNVLLAAATPLTEGRDRDRQPEHLTEELLEAFASLPQRISGLRAFMIEGSSTNHRVAAKVGATK